MKKLVLLLLCYPLLLNATKAPDFTVTDYNNKLHSLYTDYLNKEKVVVLKLFFVDCPPCNDIAPLVQTAYNRWGAGNGRVQFIELSTQPNESNSYVKGYAMKHGLTFPGVGSDGGSSAAVAPYKDGKTFGPWYSTPTFVVIAPNGEVNYRVNFGKSDIVSLDSAIAKALRIPSGGTGGGDKCTDSFSIKVFNPVLNHKVVTYDLYNQGNSKYDLQGGLYNCQFFFPATKDNYVVGLEFPQTTLDPLNGISTLDIVLLQKHILGIKPFNNLQYALADVNNNGTVSVSDITELRKLILGSINTLKVGKIIGYANNPKGFDYKSPNYVFVKDLISKKGSHEFAFGRYGDFSSASEIKLHGSTKERSSCTLQFNVNVHKENGFYYYVISSNEDISMLSLQMILECNIWHDFEIVKLINLPGLRDLCIHFSKTLKNTLKFSLSWFNPTLNYESIKANEEIVVLKSKNLLEFHKTGIQEVIIRNETICDIEYNFISPTTPKIKITTIAEAVLFESNSSMRNIVLYSNTGMPIINKKLSTDCKSELIETGHLQMGVYFAQIQLQDGSYEVKKIFVPQ